MNSIDKKIEKSISRVGKLKNNKGAILPYLTFDDNLYQSISTCGDYVCLEHMRNKETNVIKSFVTQGRTCKSKFCPVCNYYKSRILSSQMLDAFLGFEKSGYRSLFLTLTTKNCSYGKLKRTLKWMNNAYRKLVKRLNRRGTGDWLKGFIRTTEITFNGKDCNPHFHVMLFISEEYFKRGVYLVNSRNNPEWSGIWRECLECDYMPVVDIRKTYKKNVGLKESVSSIKELQKYCIKSTDLTKVGSVENMEIIHNQLKGLRFIATSQNIKLKENKKEFDKDLWELVRVDSYKWSAYTRKYERYQTKEYVKENGDLYCIIKQNNQIIRYLILAAP